MTKQYFNPRSQKAGDVWTVKKRMTFDIEAANWTEVVALGAYDEYRDEYHLFTAENGADPVDQFVDLILSRKYRSYRIIAHNGGKYDFGFVLDKLTQREGWEFSIIPRNGSIISMTVTDPNVEGQNRTFQDSIALLPRPLDHLSKAFAGRGKNDFDVEKIKYPPAKMKAEGNWQEMLDYLYMDCKLLSDVIDGFVDTASELLPDDERLTPSLTIASTTMSVFRQYYQQHSIPHATETAEEHLREAYYGGRTEVFRHRHHVDDHGLLNHYDVNSLYPYVYGTMRHPIGKEMHLSDPDINELSGMGLGGIVKIDARVPESCKYPVLPTRERLNGSEKVLFPAGQLSGWYELREILYARNVGALTDIKASEAYLYPLGRPFDAYAKEMYSLKNSIDSSENPAKYAVVKLLLNSFWGKFGMQRDQSKVVQTSDRLPPEGSEAKALGSTLSDKTRNRDRGLYEVPERSNATYILPQIAVSVTALARIEMHKWFMQAKEKGGSIWYCDTDSIATNVELPESDELGGMDLENVSEEAYFIAPKVYAEKHVDGGLTMKAKGMRSRKLPKENSFEDYRAAIENRDPTRIGVKWESVVSPMSNLKSNETMDSIERDRAVQRLDDKRDHDIATNDSRPVNVTDIRRKKMEAEAGQHRRRRDRERYGKAFERQYAGEQMNADQAQFDAEALRDSTLTADEMKERLWQSRKDAMR